MKKYDVIIAIDPDVDKSGVAVLEVATRKLEVSSLTIDKLIDYFEFVKTQQQKTDNKIVVVVEASWSNTHNHHLAGKHTLKSASKTGYNIGRNHQHGIIICNLAKRMGFEVVEQSPLHKFWNGKDRKITHKELSYFTEITGRTSQEMRDSALIAWNFANLPIKIKNF
jgi:hypothetical protein